MVVVVTPYPSEWMKTTEWHTVTEWTACRVWPVAQLDCVICTMHAVNQSHAGRPSQRRPGHRRARHLPCGAQAWALLCTLQDAQGTRHGLGFSLAPGGYMSPSVLKHFSGHTVPPQAASLYPRVSYNTHTHTLLFWPPYWRREHAHPEPWFLLLSLLLCRTLTHTG